MNILLQDIYSSAEKGRLYGSKYDLVTVVADHTGTLIVEGKTGKFSVCCDKVMKVPESYSAELSREINKLRRMQDQKTTPAQIRIIANQERIIEGRLKFINNTFSIVTELNF